MSARSRNPLADWRERRVWRGLSPQHQPKSWRYWAIDARDCRKEGQKLFDKLVELGENPTLPPCKYSARYGYGGY